MRREKTFSDELEELHLEKETYKDLKNSGLLGELPLERDIEKYEHELSTLEHIRDYIQIKIDIVLEKIKECKHMLETLNKDDKS